MTLANSQAQLKLKDETIISLKPNTKYSVSVFKLDKKKPQNNRYVGKLIEGVLISISGQGKNSTHDNHILKTPIVTIAVRGTLYESGFNTELSNPDKKKTSASKQALGVGWTLVGKGIIAIRANDSTTISCDIRGNNPQQNACFYQAWGIVDKNSNFIPAPIKSPKKKPIIITPMNEQQLQDTINKITKLFKLPNAFKFNSYYNLQNLIDLLPPIPKIPEQISIAQQEVDKVKDKIAPIPPTPPIPPVPPVPPVP